MKSNKLIKYLTIGIAGLGVSIFIILWYSGAFAEVKIERGNQGGYLLIGADHKGSYQEIGTVFTKVKEAQKQNGLDSSMFVGVYFDDPGKVKEADLRSFAGLVIKDSSEGQKIIQSNPNFHFISIPNRKSYYTELETGGMLSMIIAAMKAYPKLGEAITADRVVFNHEGMAFEEYHNGFTRFVMFVE